MRVEVNVQLSPGICIYIVDANPDDSDHRSVLAHVLRVSGTGVV